MEQKKNSLLPKMVYQVPVEKIAPNPDQPRRLFDSAGLEELARSIGEHGVLQPLTVQREGGGYVLVAGERRLRAAKLAGLSHVPCLVVRLEEQDSAILALVENLQRRDLHYLEEAAAMARLLGAGDLSQEELARRLGLSQSAVANKLRLLRLEPSCATRLRDLGLTERHARALLRLDGEQLRLRALDHIGKRQLNVADSEAYINSLLGPKAPKRRRVIVLKDVRLFLNTLDKSVDTIRRAGVDARCQRQDSEEAITITITIPNTGARRSG